MSGLQRAPLAGADVRRPDQGRTGRPTSFRTAGRSAEGLPTETSTWLEGLFGHDFSAISVHADAEGERRSTALGARAVTDAGHVFVHPRHFDAHSTGGRRLLAHEFAHVVQQRQGRLGHALAGGRPAAGYLTLEREADEAAARSARSPGPVPIESAAPMGAVQASPLEEVEILAREGLEGLARWMTEAEGAAGTLIPSLWAQREQLRGLTTLPMTASVAARLEEISLQARSDLPSWLPVPDTPFRGPPTQQAVVVAIPVGAVVLLLLVLLMLLWLLLRSNPQVRRAQDRAAQEVLDRIRESLRPQPSPEQEPEQDPKKKPDGPGPVNPPPAPEERRPKVEKVADSNVFMDRVEGGAAQRLRVDVGYLADPRLRLRVPAAAIAEATRVDPNGTQAARLAGLPGGASILPDVDGDVEPLRPAFPKILSRRFDENDLRICLRAKERGLPLVSTNSDLASQVKNPSFPARVAAVGDIAVEIP